jgi:hypothetical protein
MWCWWRSRRERFARLGADDGAHRWFVIPSEASNASAERDLGQLRASEAGAGSEIAKRPLLMPSRKPPEFNWMQRRKTGTGGAYAPLSEILPSARVARFVRMTEKTLLPLLSYSAKVFVIVIRMRQK